ncbi:GPR1/FUN34/YaaH family transporter [Escherichia coli]
MFSENTTVIQGKLLTIHSMMIFRNYGNTKSANPAPLGLMGFGMTTILLNLHNVGYFVWTVLFLPWAFSTAASP